MKNIVIDFEFAQIQTVPSGVHPVNKNEIIQIGAVMLDDRLKKVSDFRSYVKPGYAVITKKTKRLTGITEEKLISAPRFAEAAEMLAEWIGKGDYRFYQWSDSDGIQFAADCRLNLLTDRFCGMINAEWSDLQKEYADRLGLRDVPSLEHAINRVGLNVSGKYHDALGDAENTARLFRLMRNGDELEKKYKEIQDTFFSGADRGSTLGDIFGNILSDILSVAV